MAGYLIKLWRVRFRLALGLLLLLSSALAVPVLAETAVLTGSFTVQLVASNVSASGIGVSYADISWETNGDATSQVFYDTAPHADIEDYAYHSNIITTPVSHHLVSLTGLSPSTTWHFRVKSVATVGGNEFIAVSDDQVFQTGLLPVYGGWVGEVIRTVTLSGFTGDLRLNTSGIVQAATQLTATDSRAWLEIPAGTRMLNAQGQPPNSLSISVLTSAPPIPRDALILLYVFNPEGVTFTPPIKLTMKYDPATLPAGVLESTLYIAYWDGSQWQALPSTVDTQAGTVSALISRLASVALLGKMPVPAPTQTPVPTSLPATTPPAPIPTPTPTTIPIPTPALTTTPSPAPEPSITQTPSNSLAPTSPPVGIFNWWPVAAGIMVVMVIAGVAWFLYIRRRV